jgi:ribosome recycling factor
MEHSMMEENENEQLRQLRGDLRLAITADTEYCKLIEDDNKRLREALERIANGPKDPLYSSLLHEVQSEAREALKKIYGEAE